MDTRSISLSGTSDGQQFRPDSLGRWAGWLARYKGRRVTIKAEAEAIRRTKKQNDRYWALLVPAYMEWVGEDDEKQAHLDICSQCNKSSKMLPTGELIERIEGTRFKSVEEYMEFTGRVERWLAKNGVEIQD